VPISHLVPQAPRFLVAPDTYKLGMGGFWVPTTLVPVATPFAWQHQWPSTISHHLLSDTNPSGNLTNSNLELATLIIGHSVQLHNTMPRDYAITCIATNNTPTQAWVYNGSTTSTQAPAFLLNLLAHKCHHWKRSVLPIYMPGSTNTVAMICCLARFIFTDHTTRSHALLPHAPWQTPSITILHL
jgi:hypothetical protein